MIYKTLLIAHRRQSSDYWEGYTEQLETKAQEWLDYYHSIDQIVEVFPSMSEFHISCEKLLDKWKQNTIK